MRKIGKSLALSVGCILLASSLGAKAGELTAHMRPANLIQNTIEYQTVIMRGKEFKFVQYIPRTNPNMVCQGTVVDPGSHQHLHSLTGVACFPKQASKPTAKPAGDLMPSNDGWSSM